MHDIMQVALICKVSTSKYMLLTPSAPRISVQRLLLTATIGDRKQVIVFCTRGISLLALWSMAQVVS